MSRAEELLYAAVGVGDVVLEKARRIPRAINAEEIRGTYDDFVKRGRDLSKKVTSSAPTKQAVAQTKTARSQVKAATTSVTKAIRASASGPRKQAVDQTKTARRQVKAAATSVTKAVRANAAATRSAARKVARAS